MLKDIQLLNVDYNGKRYYGATQLWFKHPFKRLAACGPTTATNLFVYLSQRDPYFKDLYTQPLDYTHIFAFQKKIWHYITPTMMGLHSVDLFEKGAFSYFKKCHIQASVERMDINPKNKPDLEELYDFILKQIIHDRPVAFLNLCAQHVVELSDWHWVLIVGISKEDSKTYIYTYDEGFYRKIDLGLWLHHTSKQAGFITFKHE